MKYVIPILIALSLTAGTAQSDILSDIKEAFETAPDRIKDKLEKDWDWIKG